MPTLQILGKISARCLIDHLPDRIFADTEISPEAIAALVGFTYNNPEIYEITVDVVGYFDVTLGFMNPRHSILVQRFIWPMMPCCVVC